jgi:hypothetical protein
MCTGEMATESGQLYDVVAETGSMVSMSAVKHSSSSTLNRSIVYLRACLIAGIPAHARVVPT